MCSNDAVAKSVTSYLLRLSYAARSLLLGLVAGQAGVFLVYPTWNSLASLPYVIAVAFPAALPVALCIALLQKAHLWIVPLSALIGTLEVYWMGFESPTAFWLAFAISTVSGWQYWRLLRTVPT